VVRATIRLSPTEGRSDRVRERNRPASTCRDRLSEMTVEEWHLLSPPWRAAFEQAWESLTVGSPPIGAVVADYDGRVISRGRSRKGEPSDGGGYLAGSYLAHAEMNALIALDERHRPEHTLYTTLEPCFLCAAATTMSHVGAVRFAGSDPVWRFLQDLPAEHPELAARVAQGGGPVARPGRSLRFTLGIGDLLTREPSKRAIATFRDSMPGLVEWAATLVSRGDFEVWHTLELDEVITAIWRQLVEHGL
jgi:tRNA(adenine34) deaminase